MTAYHEAGQAGGLRLSCY